MPAAEPLTVEPLPWDTEFFGVQIGRVELDGATPGALREIDAAARELGIVCLYGSHDPAAFELSYMVQTAGWRLVEVGVVLTRNDPTALPTPTIDVTVRRGTVDDIPGLDGAITPLAA